MAKVLKVIWTVARWVVVASVAFFMASIGQAGAAWSLLGNDDEGE